MMAMKNATVASTGSESTNVPVAAGRASASRTQPAKANELLPGAPATVLLASQEAKAAGFDEALLTDMNGHVAEGPGANLFYEKDGKLFTPAPGHILAGITRATVLEICETLGIAVEEKIITLEELKQADAVFYCGTAAEVIGWKKLDDTEFPLPWEDSLSRMIQLAYKNRVTERTTALQTETA